jgi:hypothetical protein
LAGAAVSVNSKSSVAAWHTTLSAPVMGLLLACVAPRKTVQTGRTKRG